MNTLTYKYIVVEDEYLIRQNIIKKIKSLQLPFLLAGEASNGFDALKLIEQICPSLVITDIRMPQYDGLELSKYLYKNHPHIKVIILSGYNDFSYAQTAIKFQVKDYLLKPVALDTLYDSLTKILISIQSEKDELNILKTNTEHLKPQKLCELLEKYLQMHYQEEISFGDLASKFGFTQEYLGKIFKKYSGYTPSKYLTLLRINEAKHLLINNPKIEIQKVGELVGYKDSFYFSRVFKSCTGIQPSEFRNQKL